MNIPSLAKTCTPSSPEGMYKSFSPTLYEDLTKGELLYIQYVENCTSASKLSSVVTRRLSMVIPEVCEYLCPLSGVDTPATKLTLVATTMLYDQ